MTALKKSGRGISKYDIKILFVIWLCLILNYPDLQVKGDYGQCVENSSFDAFSHRHFNSAIHTLLIPRVAKPRTQPGC